MTLWRGSCAIHEPIPRGKGVRLGDRPVRRKHLRVLAGFRTQRVKSVGIATPLSRPIPALPEPLLSLCRKRVMDAQVGDNQKELLFRLLDETLQEIDEVDKGRHVRRALVDLEP